MIRMIFIVIFYSFLFCTFQSHGISNFYNPIDIIENKIISDSVNPFMIQTRLDIHTILIEHPPSMQLLELFGKQSISPKEQMKLALNPEIDHGLNIEEFMNDHDIKGEGETLIKQTVEDIQWDTGSLIVHVDDDTKCRYIVANVKSKLFFGNSNKTNENSDSIQVERIDQVTVKVLVYLRTKIMIENDKVIMEYELPIKSGHFQKVIEKEDLNACPSISTIASRPSLGFSNSTIAINQPSALLSRNKSNKSEQEEFEYEQDNSETIIPAVRFAIQNANKDISQLPIISQEEAMEILLKMTAKTDGPFPFFQYLKMTANPKISTLSKTIFDGASLYYSGNDNKIWRWLKGDQMAINTFVNLNAAYKHSIAQISKDAISNCLVSTNKALLPALLKNIKSHTSNQQIISYINSCRIDGDQKNLIFILDAFIQRILNDDELVKQVALLLVHNLFSSNHLRERGIMAKIQMLNYETLIYDAALEELNSEMFIEYLPVILEEEFKRGNFILNSVIADLSKMTDRTDQYLIVKFLKIITNSREEGNNSDNEDFFEIEKITSNHLVAMEKCLLISNSFFGSKERGYNQTTIKIFNHLFDSQVGKIKRGAISPLDKRLIPNLLQIMKKYEN